MAIRCETDFLAFACLRTLAAALSAGFADRLSLRKSFGSVSALLPSDAPAVGMLWQAGGGFANPFAMLSKFDGAKIVINWHKNKKWERNMTFFCQFFVPFDAFVSFWGVLETL